MTNKKFKEAAKRHQIKWREGNIGTNCNTYTTWLADEDAVVGKNFFDGFQIFNAVKERYPNFYIDLYSDTLRSEHIPFNLFIPFREDLTYCKDVLNEIMNGTIQTIAKQAVIDQKENIKVEFAPSPKEDHLGDRTSFDAYIEYTHVDGSMGILGIEVKYTEREYKLKPGSTEETTILDRSSKYFTLSRDCGLYREKSIDALLSDNFRQVWRNHLLAESTICKPGSEFKHSTSITLYPSDNGHFSHVSEEYTAMLIDRKESFVPVTYEKFLLACYKHCPSGSYKAWLDYLTDRYIIY